MKKRSTKTKRAPKSKSAAKPRGRSGARRAKAPARTSRATSYSPPPLKGDGWPPFRYPLL
jgi:hypothetical protein